MIGHVVVVDRLLRPMEGNGVTRIFSCLQKLTVPPQADGAVGTPNCCAFSLYNSGIIISTISFLGLIYYRFIVCLPIGLDLLFITFLLDFFLSWTSLSISSSAMSVYTHALLGLPTGILPSTLYSIHFVTQPSSLFLITCPYSLSLPLLMTVVIGWTQTNFLNSSLVLLYFIEIPHVHLII